MANKVLLKRNKMLPVRLIVFELKVIELNKLVIMKDIPYTSNGDEKLRKTTCIVKMFQMMDI